MIDKQENLIAYSVHSLPKTYVLLLGSGISLSSGLPSGWDITTDLVKTYATLQGEKLREEPAVWFKAKFGRDPDYSEMMELLQQTSTSRMMLIWKYFTP
ncbi:MAG: hypothetical protein EOP10_00030 [Proteobacteria bacterium]|nr:MAG: hypothetical protein EOP10_00030 [Pseudomonadota bacterium]